MKKLITLALVLALGATAIATTGCGGSSGTTVTSSTKTK